MKFLFWALFHVCRLALISASANGKSEKVMNLKALLSVGKDAEGLEVDIVQHQKQREEFKATFSNLPLHGLLSSATFIFTIPRLHYMINTCISFPLEGAENMLYALIQFLLVFASDALSGLLLQGRTIYLIKTIPKLLLSAYLLLSPTVSLDKYLLNIPCFCLAMAFFSMLMIFIEIKN